MKKTSISVNLTDKIGVINRNLYGHFSEHIGGVMYGGLWVGPDSPIPNIRGWRKDLVEEFKKVAPPVIRWPGGCFAEVYNWRDGIGDPASRPRTLGWWYRYDGKVETNAVGTHEFIDFCRLVGAEPYIAINISSLSPMDARDWVDYCNSPRGTSSMALLREKNGSPEPFNVKYWGIGNENWADGGDMTPEYYCTQFRKYAKMVANLNPKLQLIACGPLCNDLEWTRRFFDKYQERYITVSDSFPITLNGFSSHMYCGYDYIHGYGGVGGHAYNYNAMEWNRLLYEANLMEPLIEQQRGLMDSYDPSRRVKLVIDEWGTWHENASGPSKGANLFEQQSTIRDAVVAALTFNIYNNHCDEVGMANIAQVVNNLQSLFLASGEKMVRTATYHVFDMYKLHQDATAVKTVVDCDDIAFDYKGRDVSNRSVSCSSSVKDGKLVISVCNQDMENDAELDLDVFGWSGKACKIVKQYIEAENTSDYNDFDEPEKVKMRETEHAISSDGKIKDVLKKASVVSYVIELN